MNAKNSLSPTTVVRASLRQMSATLDGEIVVLNFEDGVYYTMDPVGARIWELVQQPRTVDEVLQTLLEEFDVEPETCRDDLIRHLDQLRILKLLETRDAVDR